MNAIYVLVLTVEVATCFFFFFSLSEINLLIFSILCSVMDMDATSYASRTELQQPSSKEMGRCRYHVVHLVS